MKFKIGDKVKVRDGALKHAESRIGVVNDYWEPDDEYPEHAYFVLFNSCDGFTFDESELYLAEQA